jgi:hypothetical protein
MTSPDAKPQEGGGMVPALLAGAGILIVAGLLIFGGDDDAAKQSEAEGKTKSASAQSKSGDEGRTGVASRNVDDPTAPAKDKPKLNPRIANSIVTGGMAPGKKEEPTSFASVDDEIAYWEDELRDANRMLEIRERAVDHIPQIEEAIRNGNDPVNGLKEFEARKKVVADNLERAKKRVEEVEDKLAKLKG